ncbi:MAG: hypothetical protein SCJ93_03785 [Bacillota bacterium]|nr:hypothetical protein [Bacillota bacterium]
MLIILRMLYLLLIGYLVYTRVKGDGCCSHVHNHKEKSNSEDRHKKNLKKIRSDNEKTDFIDI